jgi:hypothetical protein
MAVIKLQRFPGGVWFRDDPRNEVNKKDPPSPPHIVERDAGGQVLQSETPYTSRHRWPLQFSIDEIPESPESQDR